MSWLGSNWIWVALALVLWPFTFLVIAAEGMVMRIAATMDTPVRMIRRAKMTKPRAKRRQAALTLR